jgi:hypothetical protein
MDDYFRPIEGFPGYRVSRTGQVQSCWSRRGRFCLLTETWLPLKPIRRLQYLTVNLARCGKKSIRPIHRLVLEAFVGPAPSGQIACHNDGNSLNNHLNNLRWGTHKSNSDDTLRHGRRARGTALKSKLTECDVLIIRWLRAEGISTNDLSQRFGVCKTNIRAVVNGKTWRHLLNLHADLGDGTFSSNCMLLAIYFHDDIQ